MTPKTEIHSLPVFFSLQPLSYLLNFRAMKLNTEKIKQELLRRGWSMKDFADAMGSPRTYPYYLMKGGSHSFRTVEKIAEVLQYDPKDLII